MKLHLSQTWHLLLVLYVFCLPHAILGTPIDIVCFGKVPDIWHDTSIFSLTHPLAIERPRSFVSEMTLCTYPWFYVHCSPDGKSVVALGAYSRDLVNLYEELVVKDPDNGKARLYHEKLEELREQASLEEDVQHWCLDKCSCLLPGPTLRMAISIRERVKMMPDLKRGLQERRPRVVADNRGRGSGRGRESGRGRQLPA